MGPTKYGKSEKPDHFKDDPRGLEVNGVRQPPPLAKHTPNFGNASSRKRGEVG